MSALSQTTCCCCHKHTCVLLRQHTQHAGVSINVSAQQHGSHNSYRSAEERGASCHQELGACTSSWHRRVPSACSRPAECAPSGARLSSCTWLTHMCIEHCCLHRAAAFAAAACRMTERFSQAGHCGAKSVTHARHRSVATPCTGRQHHAAPVQGLRK